MTGFVRLRAHAGLWTIVAVLALAGGLVAGGTGPLTSRTADQALRQSVSVAPSYLDRDLRLTRRVFDEPPPLASLVEVAELLPVELREVTQIVWGFQHTSVALADGVGARLVGEGVTTEPHGEPPVISFHTQSSLADEITLVAGRPPATDPAGEVVEVMVAAEVADRLGVTAGADYHAPTSSSPQPIPIRVSGVFTVNDPTAPAWAAEPLLRETTTTVLPPSTSVAIRAGLVTDEAGIALLTQPQFISALQPVVGVRVRLDAAALDRRWAEELGPAAVARAHTDPQLGGWRLATRLPGLLDDYARQSASVRAITAVVATSIATTLLGLLVLAGRVIAARRRTELTLLRARGGSAAGVARWLVVEAAGLTLPATVVGAIVARLLLPDATPTPLSPGGVLPVLAGAAVALVVVPAAGVVASRYRTRPIPLAAARVLRITAELSVLLLAAVGVALVHQRGLTVAGVDPYLSAVPVLLALAAALLALRLYPGPLRLLAVLTGRARAPVGFIALARAGRAAPATALGLLVLVAAVALGGFAGAVNTGLAQARDASAVAAVGAHLRLAAAGLPEAAVTAAAGQPGVAAVAAAGRAGHLLDPVSRNRIQQVEVVVIDTAAYQRVLAEIGVAQRLPPVLLAAAPNQPAIPILAPTTVAVREQVALRIGDREHPVRVVGDLAGIPGPNGDHGWALVPRQALPDPGPLDELIIAGADADPDVVAAAVDAAVGGIGTLAVISLAGHRAELEDTGYNDGLTRLFAIGVGASATGGTLAVVMALVVPARERGRELSLLRTMGLSVRQVRRLLLTELLPTSTLAVVAGAAAGIGVPLLIGPALGLGEFTGGARYQIAVDPMTVGVLAGLVTVVAGAGVLLQVAVNRRLGLGGVLRVS